jgi:hypothetical protein
MQCCEIETVSAYRHEPNSLEAEPLRAAKAKYWSSSPPRKACFQEPPQDHGVAFCSSSSQGLSISSSHGRRNSNTTWHLRCILPGRPASEPRMKATIVNALLALKQQSPAPRGRARPNHSVNLRANGIARCPVATHSAALHFAAAGHRAMPSATGYLER